MKALRVVIIFKGKKRLYYKFITGHYTEQKENGKDKERLVL